LAVVSELSAIAAAVVALAAGNRNPAVWILPLFLGLIYGLLYPLCYGIAVIDQKGPVSERFPGWYRALYPRWQLDLADAMYGPMANVFLVAFPAGGTFISLIVLWIALTGQLNP
jgi:hypothetical protein